MSASTRPMETRSNRQSAGRITRALDMSQMARDAGLSCESLYESLSGDRDPAFGTILKIAKTLGLHLHPKAIPND